MTLAMMTLRGESSQNYGEQTGNVSLKEYHTEAEICCFIIKPITHCKLNEAQ